MKKHLAYIFLGILVLMIGMFAYTPWPQNIPVIIAMLFCAGGLYRIWT